MSANPQQASGRKYKMSWAGVLNIPLLASPGLSLVLRDKRQDYLLGRISDLGDWNQGHGSQLHTPF